MSDPTAGELAFAKRYGVDATALARARLVFNTIASLPWPEPERLALLVRLAQAARADVGEELGRRALAVAPLDGFDALMPVFGLAEKRVIGLMRALADVDPGSFSPEAPGLREAWVAVAALRAENTALREELSRAHAMLHALDGASVPSPTRMRLSELASSVSEQVGLADAVLRTRASGLRLAGLDLHVRATATADGEDVALELGLGEGASAIALRFAPSETPSAELTTRAVPDVRGYTAALARRKLERDGFTVTLSAVAGGRVVRDQTPSAGSLAPTGSTVRLLLR